MPSTPTDKIKFNLTDSEWMRLIDGDDEDSELPRCCANISALRDEIITLAREGRRAEVGTWRIQGLSQKFRWCLDGHDLSKKHFPVLHKLMTQAGFDFDAPTPEHTPEPFEKV